MTNPITDGEGIFFNRSRPGGKYGQSVERTDEAVQAERKKLIIRYGALLGLQFGIYFATYMACAGFIVPFLNHPMARIVISTVFVWQIAACALHWWLAPISNLNRAILSVFVVVFAIIPGLLLPVLGPACIVIISALGPILNGR